MTIVNVDLLNIEFYTIVWEVRTELSIAGASLFG